MSVRVMTWVWEHSRSRKTERLVLLAIADCASDDGANAYPSMTELVRKTGLSERGVQGAIGNLVKLGELFVGRNAGPRGCNRYRVIMQTPADGAGAQDLRPADGAPPQTVHPRRSRTPQRLHPPADPAPPPPQTVRGAPADPAPGTVLEPSLEPSVRTSSSQATTKATIAIPERLDVERVCKHLADRIEANGSNRPTVTKAWRDAARRLLDRDGRTIEQVIRAIDWCQDDDFWRSNVMSLPKLREKYDQLRLAAQRGARDGPRRSTTDERVGQALALAAELDANPDLLKEVR